MENIPSNEGSSKKSVFDNLSREELITKCKGLLTLAQKAKQAKTELQSEVESHKIQLEKCETEKKANQENVRTLQELVDSLTEQKLNYITEVDLAKSKLKAYIIKCNNCEEEIKKYKSDLTVKDQYVNEFAQKLSDLDSEIVSLKRQNNRLVEENEQLINQLTELESSTVEFNNIGMKQQEQLRKLEEKFQTDSDSYKTKIEELNNIIKELENKIQINVSDKDNTQNVTDYENKIKEMTELYESEKVKKEKANIKLKSYRDKILKCAACITQLKNSRFILSKTVKEYSENIPKWQNDILKASKVLESKITELNNENTSLKEKLQKYEKQINETSQNEFDFAAYTAQVEELTQQRVSLYNELSKFKEASEINSSKLSTLDNEKSVLKDELRKMKNDAESNTYQMTELTNERNSLNNDVVRLKAENEQFNLKIEHLTNERDLLENKISNLHKQLSECSNSNSALISELSELKYKYQQVSDAELPAVRDENKSLKDQLNNNKKKNDDLTTENSELHKQVKELKADIRKLNGSLQSKTENVDAINNLNLQIKALESEKAMIVKEKLNARDNVVELENQNKILSEQVHDLRSEIDSLKTHFKNLAQEKSRVENSYKTEKDTQINNLKANVKSLQEKLDLLKIEHDNLQDLNGLLREEVETLKLSLEQPKDDNLSDLNVSLQTDIVKLETKLSAYKQENSSLLTELKETRVKVKEYDSLLTEYEETKSKLTGYKTENTELLNEMKEINQVLKERGESISKLQKAVAEMERLVETLEKDRDTAIQEKDAMIKRVETLENDLKIAEHKLIKCNVVTEQTIEENNTAIKKLEEKDTVISSLKDEIDRLRQQQNSSELPNEDNMSTSTISRAEENSRMKDLDETFEDKYSKLRIFALKLKKKLNDTISQLENAEQDKARLEKLLSEYGPNNKRSVQQKSDDVDGSKKLIDNVDHSLTVSELETKVKSLTEASENLRKTTAELEKVKAEFNVKNQELVAEIEAHKVTKDSLEKARRDVKKKNVLSLEMEDYERSMKELTAKMEDSKKKMVQMESTIDTQEATITALKVQIKLLEEQVKSEETQNRLIKEELQHAVEESREKDNVIQIKNNVIMKLEQELEDEKRKNEEADLEMTSALSEKEKIIMTLGEEKAELNNKLKRQEFKCAELDEVLKITTIELADLKTEYTSYKVRAQAVLRQNQTVDHSQEEQLKEETAALRTQIETLIAKLSTLQDQLSEQTAEVEVSRRRASEAGSEAARAQQRTARLQADLTRIGQQLESERAQHKLQVSTLTQCYKTQVNDLEMKLQKETEALRKQLLAAQEHAKTVRASPADVANQNQYMLPVIPKEDGSDGEMDINVSMIPREEGEGSESAPSPPLSKSFLIGGAGNRSPVPLERLLEEGVPEDESLDAASLGLTPDQEISDLKRKLTAQQQRVKHVTVLLSESERECARMAQLSELLKSELRRVRGATQHAHNTEYMKNVTLKFLTLPPGDERSRLVPVLQKILTLTSDETHKIHAIAKGLDPNPGKGWGSYLPWPGGK